MDNVGAMPTHPIASHTTALMLIDLQEFVVATPTAPYPGPEVANRCGKLAAAFRAAGRTVVIVRIQRGDQPVPGGGLVTEATPLDSDILITKPAVGAFSHTDLHDRLRELGITTLVMSGIATNFGVESTARAAFDLGYKLVFVSDAMTSFDEIAHQVAVERVFPRFGTVMDTDAVIAALGS